MELSWLHIFNVSNSGCVVILKYERLSLIGYDILFIYFIEVFPKEELDIFQIKFYGVFVVLVRFLSTLKGDD